MTLSSHIMFVWLVAGADCSERKVLLVGCWWLVCSERKVLQANRLTSISKFNSGSREIFDLKGFYHFSQF
jgi:hypothetical protein